MINLKPIQKCLLACDAKFIKPTISMFVVSGMLVSGQVYAAVWLFQPRATVEQGYDDNFRLSPDSSDEDEVWTSTLTGELALRGKSERLDVEGLLILDKVFFNGDDDNLTDRDNQLLGFSSRYRATERNRLSFNAALVRDSLQRTSRVEVDPGDIVVSPGDDEVRDPDENDTDANLVNDNVRRTRIRLRPGWDYKFTERTTGGISYNYQDLSYSGRGSNLLNESERHSVRPRISHRVTEKDQIIGLASAAYFRPDNDNDIDTYEARIGWIRDISETLQIDMTFGGRYSEFDNADQNSDTGFVANIGALKRFGLTRFRINLERRVNPSGSGDEVETDQVTLRIRRQLSEKLNLGFRGRYFETDSTGGGRSASDRKLLNFQPSLEWRFLQSWTLGTSYRFRYIDRDGSGGANSNAVFINLNYLPPSQF